MLSLLSEVDAAVWECSRVRHFWEAIIQKYFDQAFLTITTFQMLWNEIGPLVSQVCRPIAQSHMTFFDALGGIYSQNAFPSPIIRINSFLHASKTTSYKHKNFFAN